MSFLDKIKNIFTRKSTQENKIDIEANVERLAKEQEEIDKLYEEYRNNCK